MEMKKVLIADDNKYMLDALQEIIQIGGYRAEVADVDRPFKLSNELPDLILMDIKMSGKDGRVICRELKSKLKTKNIPIILYLQGVKIKIENKKYSHHSFISFSPAS